MPGMAEQPVQRGGAQAEEVAGNGRNLNVNVGLLGHIDCGKTSIARALSTHISTAALDKHPQSKERGITLDLGFSSFSTEAPDDIKGATCCGALQFTLVDCPGHASLIRTVLGGAQIIDIMALVIDATKGVQTQTAECIVIGEILRPKRLVLLNKCDALQQDSIEKVKRKLQRTLRNTVFADCTIIPVSAAPVNGGDPYGMEPLISELTTLAPRKTKGTEGKFLYAVDHCFGLKGQGTVLTGTVLRGQVTVNQTVELPDLKVTRKVKSMQMFHKPVQRAIKGERAAICVTQLDADSLERGIVCEPGSIPVLNGTVASALRVRYFKGKIASGSKFHISIGHSTVIATATFFCDEKRPQLLGTQDTAARAASYDPSASYLYCSELLDEGGITSSEQSGKKSEDEAQGPQYVLLSFEQPIVCDPEAVFIASRLDTDVHSKTCRIAFCGKLAHMVDTSKQTELFKLHIYKHKHRDGVVERLQDNGRTAICKGMFKRETDLTLFIGMRVFTDTGLTGTIESTFGKTGKFRVALNSAAESKPGKVHLRFKRLLFDPSKKMRQDF